MADDNIAPVIGVAVEYWPITMTVRAGEMQCDFRFYSVEQIDKTILSLHAFTAEDFEALKRGILSAMASMKAPK